VVGDDGSVSADGVGGITVISEDTGIGGETSELGTGTGEETIITST
jgi:hypothetical protein